MFREPYESKDNLLNIRRRKCFIVYLLLYFDHHISTSVCACLCAWARLCVCVCFFVFILVGQQVPHNISKVYKEILSEIGSNNLLKFSSFFDDLFHIRRGFCWGTTQSVGTVDYTNCISAERKKKPPNGCPRYDITPSDSKAPVLEIRGISIPPRSTLTPIGSTWQSPIYGSYRTVCKQMTDVELWLW